MKRTYKKPSLTKSPIALQAATAANGINNSLGRKP